jgi:hypothetical protein
MKDKNTNGSAQKSNDNHDKQRAELKRQPRQGERRRMSWIGLLPWFSAAGTTDTVGRASRAADQKVQATGLETLKKASQAAALAVGATLVVLAMTATPASAAQPCSAGSFTDHVECQFGELGSGPGQFTFPNSVAVNNDPSSPSYGDVYVLDGLNARVEQFSGEGVFVRSFGEGLGRTVGVYGALAVDQSTGELYVLTEGRVQRYSEVGVLEPVEFPVSGGSIAVGPTGDVWVGETDQVQAYDPATGMPEGLPVQLPEAGQVTDLAINGTGEFYVTEGELEGFGSTRPTRHYSATGVPVGEQAECGDVPGEFDCESPGQARSLTLEPATGEVFVNHGFASSGSAQVRGFTAAGVKVAVFATAGGENREGIAFDEQTGALYTPTLQRHVTVAFPPPPGPVVSGESVSGIEPDSAVVHAVINPNAPAFCGETHYLVQYGLTAGYGKTAPVSEGALSRSFDEDPVEVPLGGLSTRTTYHYRFVAFDECEETPGVETAHTTDGEDATFTTQPPALIEEQWATAVRSTSVTLHATIDPFGFATEFRFQYLTQAEFEADGDSFPDDATSTAAAQLGSTKTEVQQHVQGLTAGQEYHYRVVAANTIAGKEEVEAGEPLTFTTQTGGEAGLPDGRQWELVSPPDKHGARVEGDEEGFVQAAADGDALVYPASGPTESEPRGHAEHTQVISKRTSTGWENYDLLPPHTTPVGAEEGENYDLFSSDLSAGALDPGGAFEPALSSEATEQGPYLFDSASRTYTPLVTGPKEGKQGDDTSEPFVPFGGEAEEGECHVTNFCPPKVQGASSDLSHIILGEGIGTGIAPLLKGASENELYEWSGGKLALVSVLPSVDPPAVNGHGIALGAGGQTGPEVVTHAVSEDGSLVFWQEQAPSSGFLSFVRDMTSEETIETPGFEGANANGSLEFAGGKVCEVITSPVPLSLKCEPVLGENHQPLPDLVLLATSEDGSIAYYKSEKNIYILHHGDSEAKLVASDIGQIREPGSESGIHPPYDPWRASPNGEWFAFMSDSPLTGYDNRDALTGAPDEEVYLYSAAAQRLVCASCDPTGERPHGTAAVNLRLADYADVAGEQQSVAATIPGWAPYTLNHAKYDPRFLSDSGRLFFNATDGLVPKDVNGQVDVYELEQPTGAPGGSESGDNCTTATRTGSQLYVPSEDGCVALISNGESDEESAFEDASETGEDVFFLSASKLSTADLDGSLAMWDAQVCTTTSPCPPAPATPPTPCSTEASCKASPTPQPTIYQAPASATFSGPGNVAPEPTKPAPASTPACSSSAGAPSTKCTRKQNLTKALAACRKDKKKAKRASCEKAAKKKYGPKAVKKKKGKK